MKKKSNLVLTGMVARKFTKADICKCSVFFVKTSKNIFHRFERTILKVFFSPYYHKMVIISKLESSITYLRRLYHTSALYSLSFETFFPQKPLAAKNIFDRLLPIWNWFIMTNFFTPMALLYPVLNFIDIVHGLGVFLMGR